MLFRSIWALEYDAKAGQATKNWSILSGGTPVVAFGEDQDGDVYYLIETVSGQGIYRFERAE